MTPFDRNHFFLQILGILSSKDWRKTEGSPAQFFSKNCQRWAGLEGC